MTTLAPSPDRLFPADAATRSVARRIYSEVRNAPILSPHGHVDAAVLADNAAFPDPATLLITPDHYVVRLLHANGVSLDELGFARNGVPSEASSRSIWAQLCRHWSMFAGTPVRYWFETELSEVFGVTEMPSAATADSSYDQIATRLADDAYRPRSLFERFGIRVLATTDDPADDLAAHRRLRDDATFAGHVVPTLRADRYMDPGESTWIGRLDAITAASGIDAHSYRGLLDALRKRRGFFLDNGGTATDTGVIDAWAEPLADADAERIHRDGLAGTVSPGDAVAYRRNLLYRFAEMSCDDGLVMQLHAGVLRNHHKPTLSAYGPDTGHDLPAVGGYSRPLERLLGDFGTNPGLHLVLFTVDETMFSREIAPLAGFYPSVYAGAPWWFLDSPSGIARYRAAVTDSAGFGKTSGFIDDTRAFCSIPARHDLSRRADAAYLASLVTTHQLGEDEAATIARDLVGAIPTRTFRLERYGQSVDAQSRFDTLDKGFEPPQSPKE
ncbi:MAG: glucuronate isomerase [Kribbellaceae bacterium]|nr:glucuronate isomerase [Kribbellaceae bacterium]